MMRDDRSVRHPAVAGTFYPGDAAELDAIVRSLLASAAVCTRAPKALIVPHAGYVYSGPIAAAAYAQIASVADRIQRVVLVGPAHRVFVDGLAHPDASVMRTPIGDVAIDRAALQHVPGNAVAHAREHSLEVQLPFLRVLLPHASIVPVIGSRAEPEAVARFLDALWGGSETLIIISSDLSHYLPYAKARSIDERTAAKILGAQPISPISTDEACGAIGINGLTALASRRGLRAELIELKSSGDTAGGRDEVVGYGAFAFHEGAA